MAKAKMHRNTGHWVKAHIKKRRSPVPNISEVNKGHLHKNHIQITIVCALSQFGVNHYHGGKHIPNEILQSLPARCHSYILIDTSFWEWTWVRFLPLEWTKSVAHKV